MEEPEITPEQYKAVSKIIFRARLNLLAIGAKFAVGLFGSNLICILIEARYLVDTDPEQQAYFQIVSMAINFVFMAHYLYSKLKQNSEEVILKVKEVLKK